MLMVDGLKVYCGLLIMKDLIKLSSNAHYWLHQVSTLDLKMLSAETDSFKSVDTSTLSTLLTNCNIFSIL